MLSHRILCVGTPKRPYDQSVGDESALISKYRPYATSEGSEKSLIYSFAVYISIVQIGISAKDFSIRWSEVSVVNSSASQLLIN